MEVTVKNTRKARYLKLDVAVRYGDEDMPFDAPLRDGNNWRATIDLNHKTILDWPQGKALSFKDMKICDEGLYTLLDDNFRTIVGYAGYVPNKLLPGSYGDYLTLDIDENGYIKNWLETANLSDFEEE